MRMTPELPAVRGKKTPFEQEETLSRPRLLRRYPPGRVKETERSGLGILEQIMRGRHGQCLLLEPFFDPRLQS